MLSLVLHVVINIVCLTITQEIVLHHVWMSSMAALKVLQLLLVEREMEKLQSYFVKNLCPVSELGITIMYNHVLGDINADHSLTDAATHVIWSFGQVYPDYKHSPASGIEAMTAKNMRFYKPDEIKYHGSVNRGAATLNFFCN